MNRGNKWAVFVEAISLLFTLLFAYTAVSKLYDWEGTRNAMYNQVFPGWMAGGLLYGLPVVELSVAVLLLRPIWRPLGLWVSLILMALFTAYVGLVITGIFGRVPCSCGGVISSLNWEEHFLFNLGFVILAVMGIRYEDGIK